MSLTVLWLPSVLHCQFFSPLLSYLLEDDQSPSLRGFHTTRFLFLREQLGTHSQNTQPLPPAPYLDLVRALDEQKCFWCCRQRGPGSQCPGLISEVVTRVSCPYVFPCIARNKNESQRVLLVADLFPVPSRFKCIFELVGNNH